MAKAKAFSLEDKDENTFRLSDFKGKWIVLYFYPKDNTPGCTLEAKEFSDLKQQFEKENAVVIGISPDSPKSHTSFCEKQNLSIILLSDPDKKTIQKYDAWKEKSMYGRKYMGVERSTFLISPTGTILEEWRKVKPKGHAQEVLNALRQAKQ